MPSDRRHLAQNLSNHRGGKIWVICEKCGLQKRYDASAMFDRLADVRLTELLGMIAKAEGCERVRNGRIYDRCGLIYDLSKQMRWE